MPPIPVHIDEPITPSKNQEPPITTTHPNNATITPAVAAGGPPPAFPAAGAAPAQPALPGPTPMPSSVPSAPPPTRTTQTIHQDPPPPQPGAVPAPPATQYQPPTAQSTPHKPPPSNAQTTTATPALAPTSTTIPQPPSTLSASHPTGYQQNLFAQELSPAQRASLDQQEEADRRGSIFAGLPGGGMNNNGSGAGVGGSGGGTGGGMMGEDAGQTAGNVWNAVKGWASVAGNKAAEMEADAWRRFGPGKS